MLRETHILEPKNVGQYTWRGGGRGSENVYTLENVDIFGWPLNESSVFKVLDDIISDVEKADVSVLDDVISVPDGYKQCNLSNDEILFPIEIICTK